MSEKEKSMPETLNGYTPDDLEYWEAVADTIGSPVSEYEDDSEYIDENGVVIKEANSN
jgi:hypothetical protein